MTTSTPCRAPRGADAPTLTERRRPRRRVSPLRESRSLAYARDDGDEILTRPLRPSPARYDLAPMCTVIVSVVVVFPAESYATTWMRRVPHGSTGKAPSASDLLSIHRTV